MGRRKHALYDDDDLDASSPPADDVFDWHDDACSGAETDRTDIEDLDDDIDVDDQILLFDGNVHPPEYYLDGLQNFNEADVEGGDYSDGTTILLDAVEGQWQQFCSKILKVDARQGFESICLAILHNFFDWFLNQKVGKDGRKKRGIKKSSSLGTMWKVFPLVFEREMGERLNPELNRSMHKVLRLLAKKHELSNKKRTNRCMTIDDLKEQIETAITTTEKSFDLGELRILTVLFLLLLAPTGSRPTATLRLRFGDIRVVLARDPEGGPHKLLTRFSLEFTKTYLGTKDAKTFTLPETLYDPSLLLNPHIFLIGILFRHGAFRAQNLTSPHHLNELDIHPGENELPIPLRKEMAEVHVFRRAVKTLAGFAISPSKPITSQMMRSWIIRIGQILGIEYPTIPYSLRYNAANEFDQSAHVSDALRNLALDHVNSTPFQKHYLGREICVDAMAIVRGQEPQQALIKQACSIGHSKSKRRPVDLTTEQAASVKTHPRIMKLKKQLRQLRRGSQGYKDTRAEIRKETARQQRALLQEIKDDWTDNQAVDDIERQLSGMGFAESGTLDRSSRPHRPAQKRLIEALLVPVQTTLEDHYRRRNNAIEAVIAYCFVEEGRSKRRSNNVSVARPAAPRGANQSSPEHPASQAALSVFVDNEKDRPTRCFVCIVKALSLAADDQHVEDLIREFFSSTDLTRHFKRKHLANIRDGYTIQCRVCDMQLDHKMHLQNHARLIHGTVS